jgi:hypothetical protein
MCNEDLGVCINCDGNSVCCLVDDNEKVTDDCADCSSADWDNFDPDQCDPIERFWFKSGGDDTVD